MKSKSPSHRKKPRPSKYNEYDLNRMKEEKWAKLESSLTTDPPFLKSIEEFRELAGQMIEQGLLEPATTLADCGPEKTYGPSREFLEDFKEVYKDLESQCTTPQLREELASAALLSTIYTNLFDAGTNKEPSFLVPLSLRYSMVMAVYMNRLGIHRSMGIDGATLFPAAYRVKKNRWLGWK